MSTKRSKQSLQTLETVRDGLWERRRTLGNWEAVAAEIGLSLGTTVRVANGYEPKKPAIRHALGLPVTLPAPVCPSCGIVHVKKCPVKVSKIPPAWEPLIAYLKAHEQAKRRAEARVYGRGGKRAVQERR